MGKLTMRDRDALLAALKRGKLPVSEIEPERARMERLVERGLLRTCWVYGDDRMLPGLTLTTKGKREARRS